MASSASDPSPVALLRDGGFRGLWIAGAAMFFVRWMDVLVIGVFTYQQTSSAFLVASMMMLRLVPLSLFGVLFGVVAARVDRKTGVAVMVGVLLASTSALLALALIGRLEVWHLGVTSFVNGVAWASDHSFRRALIGDIAGPSRMGRAMAWDVGASNASRLAGPSVGGLLLAYAGVTAVFALAVLLYVVGLIAVLRLPRAPAAPRGGARSSLRQTLAAGFVAARASPRLTGTLWITMLYNLFGWPVLSMIPVIGKDRLGLAAGGIGVLASMDGIGSLIGAIVCASIARPARYGQLYVSGVVCSMVMVPLFSLSTHVLLTAAALFAVGVGQSAFAVMQSTIVYVAAPPDRRMQAMGLLTMCIGIGPLGFITLGVLAERIGAPYAAATCAVTGLAVLAVSYRIWGACWRQDGRSN
ncbi:MAG: MFS transporter [Lautropia sp.]